MPEWTWSSFCPHALQFLRFNRLTPTRFPFALERVNIHRAEFQHWCAGQFFHLTGAGFPAHSSATVRVNNQPLGTVIIDGDGDLSLLLSTTNSDEGAYVVTISVNPSATAYFSLDIDAPVRPQEESGPIFDVPTGIALTKSTFLPVIWR
jgi:hypothetical protein